MWPWKKNVHRVSQSHEHSAISVDPTGNNRSSLDFSQEHGPVGWPGDCRSPLVQHYSQLDANVLNDDILVRSTVSTLPEHSVELYPLQDASLEPQSLRVSLEPAKIIDGKGTDISLWGKLHTILMSLRSYPKGSSS